MAQLSVVPLWIDGKAAEASQQSLFDVYSYGQGRIVHRAQSANVEHAVMSVEAAERAFKDWSRTSASKRRSLLLRIVELLERETKNLTEEQMLETSCTEAYADFNVRYAARLVGDIASRLSSISGEIPQVELPEQTMTLVFKEPIGVMLTITPWNAAVLLGLRAIIGQIAAGCTVVWKASELCPRTIHRLREIIEEAGVPAGVINVIQTSRNEAPAVTEAIIAHRAIRKVEFIGSRGVGNIIGQMAAKYTKPILLELGGKSVAIVLSDANLDQASSLCLQGITLNHGQICFSTERILVHESISEEFIILLKKKAKDYISATGLPVADSIKINAENKLRDAIAKGAQIVIGGPTSNALQTSSQPTILTGITRDMLIFDEESFGPSASLYTFKTDEEAIKMANDSDYGLTAAVHTSSMERGIWFGRNIEAGAVHINNMTNSDEPTIPCGGTKASGWGRSNGTWSLNEYLHLKTITVNMGKMITYVD